MMRQTIINFRREAEQLKDTRLRRIERCHTRVPFSINFNRLQFQAAKCLKHCLTGRALSGAPRLVRVEASQLAIFYLRLLLERSARGELCQTQQPQRDGQQVDQPSQTRLVADVERLQPERLPLQTPDPALDLILLTISCNHLTQPALALGLIGRIDSPAHHLLRESQRFLINLISHLRFHRRLALVPARAGSGRSIHLTVWPSTSQLNSTAYSKPRPSNSLLTG